MKELSIKQKAKAYDEAIKRGLDYIRHTPATEMVTRQDIFEAIFPELKESEDERIRNALIRIIRNTTEKELFRLYNVHQVNTISWLEKQGEKKPTSNLCLAWSENEEKMLRSLEGIVKDYWAKAEQEKNEIKIREASNVSYFLKTIQKSPLCWIKCSEGLPNRDGTYLVVTDGRHNDVYDMARYDSIEGWHKASEIIYWMPIPQLNNKSIIEQKLANSAKTCKDKQKPVFEMKTPEESLGIDSDTYNKIVDECVYGEQKPADKVEPKFKVGDKIYLKPEHRMPDDDTPIADTIHEIIAIDDKHYRFKGSFIFIEDQDKFELVEQKPAEWSEEDEKIFERLKEILNIVDAELCKKLNGEAILIGEAEFNYLKFGIAYCRSWLELRVKSLTPQSQWKPSDGQMKAFAEWLTENEFIRDSAHVFPVFKSLYNELKKLREE